MQCTRAVVTLARSPEQTVVSLLSLVRLFCNPMNCSSPGFSVHGLFQAKILEWVAISSPEDLPNPEMEPSCTALQADSLPLSYLLLPFHGTRGPEGRKDKELESIESVWEQSFSQSSWLIMNEVLLSLN